MLREFQFGIHSVIVVCDNDIAAGGKRPRVENFGAPDEIDTRGFVNVAGDAQMWLVVLNELPDRRTADGSPVCEAIQGGGVRRSMTDHQLQGRIRDPGVCLREHFSELRVLILKRRMKGRQVGPPQPKSPSLSIRRFSP